MHKKILIIAAIALALLSSCKKTETLDWKTANEVWLEQNARSLAHDPNFHTTSTGLQYLVLREGLPTERTPNKSGYVTIHYAGMLIDGHIFDTTNGNSEADLDGSKLIEQVKALKFGEKSSQMQMSNLIKGMSEGLSKMRAPGQAIFFIPQDLAYGKEGVSTPGYNAYIPPYSTLIFKVELIGCYL